MIKITLKKSYKVPKHILLLRKLREENLSKPCKTIF